MVDLTYCLTSLLFFGIPLYYCINLNSSFTCCLFSGDIYLSFGISLLNSVFSALTVFDAFVTLSAILLSIKSPVASAVFGFALFEAAFVVFVVDFLALLRDF